MVEILVERAKSHSSEVIGVAPSLSAEGANPIDRRGAKAEENRRGPSLLEIDSCVASLDRKNCAG